MGDRDKGRQSPLQRFLNARFVAPGLAVIGLLVLALSYHQYQQSMTSTEAALSAAPDLALAESPAADGGMRLGWREYPEADGYRVVLYSPALQEVARFDVGAATFLEFDADEWQVLQPVGEPMIWRIEILRAGELLGASSPGVIPVAGKRP